MTALRHAIELDLAYDRPLRDHHDLDRLVVNMLRHEYSNYDNDQSQNAHRVVCEAIGNQFAWLYQECRRQIERRADNENIEAEFRTARRQWESVEKARRALRSRTSSEVIGAFNIGDHVIAAIAGREREGTITWIGRRRVEVAYVIKTGAARSRRLDASDVRVVVTERDAVRSGR
jgi:hypothetical protein